MQLKHQAEEQAQKSLDESNNQSLMDAVAPQVETADEFATPAALFGIYEPTYHKLIDSLSTGELRRLAKNLPTFPLNSKEHIDITSSKDLREAAAVGDKLMQAKTAMMLSFMMEQENLLAQQKQNEAAAQAVVSNETEKANGEVQA